MLASLSCSFALLAVPPWSAVAMRPLSRSRSSCRQVMCAAYRPRPVCSRQPVTQLTASASALESTLICVSHCAVCCVEHAGPSRLTASLFPTCLRILLSASLIPLTPP